MECLKQLDNKYKLRKFEAQKLHFLLNNSLFILIYGNHNVGKTFVTKNIIQDFFASKTCWIDCYEINNLNNLYNEIAKKLLTIIVKPSNRYYKFKMITTFNCYNRRDFINSIKSCLEEINNVERNHFIFVFDNASYVLKYDKSFFNFLAHLKDLLDFDQVSFTIVLIDNKEENFFLYGNKILITKPYTLYFESYKLEEVNELVVDLCPDEFNKEVYSQFVNLVLNYFYLTTKDLQTLRYICQDSFKDLTLNIAKEENLVNEEKIDDEKNKVSNKKIGFTEYYKQFKIKDKYEDALIIKSFTDKKHNYDLSVNGKYILIAAFCASYNSPKSDLRFFVREKIEFKNRNYKSAFTNSIQVIDGPKLFTLERLIHIYKALIQLNETKNLDSDKLDFSFFGKKNNMFYRQLKTFIDTKLINQLDLKTISSLSSNSKFRVSNVVNYEFVKSISSSLELDLDEFLEFNLVKK